jgi:hypothetical protein
VESKYWESRETDIIGYTKEDNEKEQMVKKEKDGDTGKKHVISIYIFVHIHVVYCEHLL